MAILAILRRNCTDELECWYNSSDYEYMLYGLYSFNCYVIDSRAYGKDAC